MNDPLGVGGIERIGDFDCDSQQRFHLQRTPRDAMPQRHPVEKLHCDERHVVRKRQANHILGAAEFLC